MKVELNLAKWGQALRVAFCIVIIFFFIFINFRAGYNKGVNDLVEELRQQQIERTGYTGPKGAIEAISLATLMDSRYTD